MALSDLEVLELVDSIKEAQKGPQGEPGVGIDSVEQYTADSFTLKLTNGASKKITLPLAQDGKDGEIGPAGPKGDTGSPGRDGAKGADGLPGSVGAMGSPGISLATAVVNDIGELLLAFTDGKRINVGRVVGPAGATGERGPVGLPGQAGRDGTAVLSGPRAPQQSDGVEGDHWIDISSAEFGFYKKSGDGWNKLANLRQPVADKLVGAGAGSPSYDNTGGGGGSGGGASVHVGPNNPALPEIGDLWLDTSKEDPILFVYVGNSTWEPAVPTSDLDGYAKIAYVDNQNNAQDTKINQNTADIASNTSAIATNTEAIAAIPAPPNLNNYATKSDLSTATAALPYIIETDKATRLQGLEIKDVATGKAAPRYAGGQIYLTDNLSFFSNVKFQGVNNIVTSSDASSIIIDGADLMPRNLLSLPELTE